MRRFSRGDLVIYQEQTGMMGAGDEDSIGIIEHYMTVCEFSKKGTLVLQTHQNNMHVTQSDDPNLRRAPFWQRWFCRGRFPRLKASPRPRALRVSS